MRTKLLFLLICLSGATACAETPLLFRERSFSAADLANAVNHFVALGENAAIREMADLDAERVSWICRILFLPRAGQPLRGPAYGMPMDLPIEGMQGSRWPLLPVAASGDSFFLLSDGGYILSGVAEYPRHYLAYCRAAGVFRRQPVPVPTHTEAERDAVALRLSPAWKAIKWRGRDHGGSWDYSEGLTWSIVKAQANRTK